MHVSGCLPCIPRRYLICFLCFLAMMLTYILRFCLSIAITEMVRNHPRNISLSEDCPRDQEYVEEPTESGFGRGEFSWDEETQGLILSSFFWGYVVSQVPGGMVAERLGGKWPLAFSIFVSSLCSILTPWAARSGGPRGLVALRVTMGLGQGFTYPSLCALVARWAPVEERGRLGALVFAGGYFGNVLSMSLSGQLLSLTGGKWSWLFVLYGCAGLLWLWCWVWLGFSRPEEHPALSVGERQQLQEYAASVNMREVLPPTPWKAMFTSIPLWGLIIAQIGHDWGLCTIITDLPKYMKSVLHFSIAQTGLRMALPYVAMCVVAILAGLLVDLLLAKKITSITASRKIFTTLAFIGPALGFVSASYSGCDKTTVTLCLVTGMGLMGFFSPSLEVNALDLSPNYAGTTIALVNGIGACSGVVTPYLVGLIIPDNTMEQWRHVFLIAAAVLVTTNIVFVLAGSGETQPWNDPPAAPPADKPHKTVIRTLSLPWNPKQSWRIEPAPYRSPSLYMR